MIPPFERKGNCITRESKVTVLISQYPYRDIRRIAKTFDVATLELSIQYAFHFRKAARGGRGILIDTFSPLLNHCVSFARISNAVIIHRWLTVPRGTGIAHEEVHGMHRCFPPRRTYTYIYIYICICLSRSYREISSVPWVEYLLIFYCQPTLPNRCPIRLLADTGYLEITNDTFLSFFLYILSRIRCYNPAVLFSLKSIGVSQKQLTI